MLAELRRCIEDLRQAFNRLASCDDLQLAEIGNLAKLVGDRAEIVALEADLIVASLPASASPESALVDAELDALGRKLCLAAEEAVGLAVSALYVQRIFAERVN